MPSTDRNLLFGILALQMDFVRHLLDALPEALGRCGRAAEEGRQAVRRGD
jgi:hypothetical protein